MKYLTLLLSLYTIGCSSYEDPILTPYLDVLEYDYKLNAKRDVISYYIASEIYSVKNRVGVCRKKLNGERVVVVKKDFINTKSDTSILALLSHEILHCSYNKEHNNNFNLMAKSTNYNMYSSVYGTEILLNEINQILGK